MFKKPSDCAAYGIPATQVLVPKQILDPAIPVNIGHYIAPHGLDFFRLPFPVWSGAVSGHIELGRFGLSYGLENLPGGVWPVEDQKQNWGF